jgi:hypothetical protein
MPPGAAGAWQKAPPMSNYRPLHGTLAYRVCLLLVNSPAPLAEEAIAQQEKKPTSWVSTMLAESVSGGWLLRQRDTVTRQLSYLAGPKLTADSLQNGPPAAPASPPPFPVVKNAAPRQPVAAVRVDFDAIVVRTGHPAPVREELRGPVGRWSVVLASMKVGDWFELPLDNMPAARKAVASANKRNKSPLCVWVAYRSGGQCIVALQSTKAVAA